MSDKPSDNAVVAAEIVERERLRGLDNLTDAARELAARVRDTAVAAGSFAEQEMAMVVGIAEEIRGRTVSPELLREARALPVIGGLRVTTHRVVDLGFDALCVSLKLGSDAFDTFLTAPRRVGEPQSATIAA